MRQGGYILLMLKNCSARGSLFIYVRTHHYLEYYFNLSDTRHAANQTEPTCAGPPRLAKVLIHPNARAAHSQRQ